MKMAWRNPCRFLCGKSNRKRIAGKPGKPQKLLFTHPGYKKVRARLQKGAYLSAGIMSHKIAYRKRKKTVFKRRLEIFIKSYFGRRL